MSRKTAPEPALPPDDAAQLIWFDPGTTTGVCIVSLDPAWLLGEGSGAPPAFKRAVRTLAHVQLGRYPRDHEHLTAPSPEAVEALEHWGASSAIVQELACVEGGLDLLRFYPHAAWGYEDFHARTGSSQEDFLSPARVGSSLRDIMLQQFPPRPAFVQLPQFGLNPDNARMQAAGLYKRGQPHATDAARHAFTFLRRARSSSELRAQAWPHLFGVK